MVTKLESQISDRVVAERERSGLSRADVASRLSLGEGSYGHYERKRYAFTIDQVFELARLFGCSVDHLLGLPSELTPDEDALLALYRNLPDNLRQLALDTLKGFSRASSKE